MYLVECWWKLRPEVQKEGVNTMPLKQGTWFLLLLRLGLGFFCLE